jgi:uncharacterized membrane protein YebE (DUF533 family)
MNTTSFLDQLLKSGRSLLEPGGLAKGSGSLPGISGDLGRGALMGGALGLLLGSKRVRKLGGSLLAYGGMAALGAVAYRAYAEWKRNNTDQPAAGTPSHQTGDQIIALESETHSRAVLKALVAAAKSDGHIETRERELIEAEIKRLDSDAELEAWLDQELRRPLDPADVASAATSHELAAEMYLASLLVTDDQSPMERMYLDELARQLKLDAGLKAQLETRARE